MSSADEKKVLLKSSDGETFLVEEAVALQFQIIKEMIEDKGAGNDEIFFPNVKGSVLLKVIEYCKKHVEAPEDDLKSWDNDFVNVDQETLFDLILAANYLNIKSLLDLTCQTVADMLKGKTPAEIRSSFNLEVKDITPEEEEKVIRENQWAFE